MLVIRHHVGQRFLVNIIAMGLKFNRFVLTILFPYGRFGLYGLCGFAALAHAGPPLPMIVPEATFIKLPRITGTTLNQRMMDTNSIIRIQRDASSEAFAPNTPVTVIRHGLRLQTPAGQSLGVLAIPVAQGHTLSDAARTRDIANATTTVDKATGKAIGDTDWIRLDVLYQETMRGDSVMTRADVKAAHPSAEHCATTPSSASPTAAVIALAGQMDMMATRGELVVISGGCTNGLSEGQQVTFWRPATTSFGRKLDPAIDDPKNDSNSVFADNPAISREQTPGYRVADGRIVAAYSDAAIVQIHAIAHAVQPGDLVQRARHHPPSRP